jgi:hypothetical protein
MSGLTNGYVEKIVKKNCKGFIGVFPCNIQPKNMKNEKNFSLIFNESKHNEDGSHFIAVCSDSNNIYYFDSLGLKCENAYILKFLNQFDKKIIENNKQIQSYNSIFCGYHCLAFVLYMSMNKKYESFFTFFDDNNLKLNDEIVIHLLIKLLK